MRRVYQSIMILFLGLAVVRCGNVGTGVANPPTNPSTKQAALAIAALFNSNNGSANLTKILQTIKNQEAGEEFDDRNCENDPGCTCEEAGREDDEDVSDEHQIQNGTFPPTEFVLSEYGANGNEISYNNEYFCANPETGEENTGSGPDGRGRLAFFELTIDIDGSCTEFADDGETIAATSTITMLDGSFGLWRNTDEITAENGDVTTPSYEPEIYGHFFMAVDGASVGELNCTIFLEESSSTDSEEDDSSGQITFSVCTDENGIEIEQEITNAVCEIG